MDPGRRACRQQESEESVVGGEEDAVLRLDGENLTCASNAGIDDRREDRSRGKVAIRRGQVMAGAAHIVRGHFAIYTKEKPLFGHYVGPVWVPAHEKGNAKYGTKIRDYELEKKR